MLEYPYYSIVSFGPLYGPWKQYYSSLASAERDASKLRQDGRNGTFRIVGCQTVKEAKHARISDASLPVVRHY